MADLPLTILQDTTAIVGDLSEAGITIVIEGGVWSISLTNPITAAIMLIFQVLEWLHIIPNPIEALMGLFVGRPRELATVQVIQRLQRSPNAAARLWGIELSKMLTNMDIVISDSSAFGQKMLGLSHRQFVVNLQWQGVSPARAQTIALNAFSREAQAGAPLEPELTKPIDPALSLIGPQSILDHLNHGLQIGESKGLTGIALQRFAERYLYINESVSNLQKTLWVDKSKLPGPQPQPQGGQCPPGYVLDLTTETCKPVFPPITPTQLCWCWDTQSGQWQPGAPPGNVLGNGGGQGSFPPPGDDELGNLGNQLCQCLDQIASAIGGQNVTLPPGQIDPCCAAIVASMQSIGASLTQVLTLLASNTGGAQPPVDLAPIQATLQAIADALNNAPPANSSNADKLVSALNAIREAIGKGAAPDLKPIVDALNTANTMNDVPHEILQQLFSDKVVKPQYSALLQGTPHTWWDTIAYVLGQIWDGHDLSDWVNSKVPAPLGAEFSWSSFLDLIIGRFTTYIEQMSANRDVMVGTHLNNAVKNLIKAEDTVLGPIIEQFLGDLTSQLIPSTAPEIGNIHVNPDTPVTTATGVTLTALFFAWLLSYAGIDVGESLTKMAEYVGAAIGFEELRDVQVGPLIRHGIGKVAEINAKQLFRQELPGSGTILGLYARRLVDQGTTIDLLGKEGLHPTLITPMSTASQHGIQPRQLIRAFESGLFTDADIRDELTFSGMRDVSINRILKLAPWLATNPQRNALIGSAEKACIAGLLTTDDLLVVVDNAEHITDLHTLISQRIGLEQRLSLAKEYESAYSAEYLAGITDVFQYQSKLEGLGLQPVAITALMAVQEAKSAATLKRQADAAERSLIRATAAAERRAAMQNFKNGVIDEIALAAALVLTGLTSVQSAAWVDLAVLQKQGSARFLYGLSLTPANAELLRSRVGAVTDQRKRGFLTDPQYHDALAALGIKSPWLNSLMATAAALATPRSTAEIIPVTTN
jgi:hypothetical protein